MRKSITILITLFVCALTAFGDTPDRSSALSPVEIVTHAGQARKLLQASSNTSPDSVRLAVLTGDDQLSVISLPKKDFLTKDATLVATTSRGRNVQVQIVRANGVNTAVKVSDAATTKPLIPLMVQYPIERNGAVTELAYYTSAHPVLISDQLTNNGQAYIRTKLDQAAARLAARGIVVPADLVNVAARLCVVEHTDHKRFMTEDHETLLPEILSLYALNSGNTYRYSVSSAGAGGMIQMIPQTYQAIRSQYAIANLEADFVDGMRDHENASEAMLLYMMDTWSNLAGRTEVQEALSQGIATKPELLAAGYNSNPRRLPGYLKTGGAGWKNLIPDETQMYLRIYSAVDQRISWNSSPAVETHSATGTEALGFISILSWIPKSLVLPSFSLFH